MLFHGLVVIAFGHLTIIGLTYGLIDEKNSIWQKLDWAWRKIMRRQINDNIRDSTLNVLQTADEIPYNELLQGKKKGIYANCRNPKDAVLTFDDGIHPENTPKVLEILKKRGVKATFFILGITISKTVNMDGTGDLNGDCEKNRRILKQMVQDGHEVGIHGFDHKRWPSISDEEWLKQVEITGSLITEVTQIKSWIIRAPGGHITRRQFRHAWKMGYSLIHWSLDTLDHKKKNEPDGSNYVMNKISTSISGIKAIKGPIILQHDTNEITHMVLPNAIDLIQKSKHQIVSMYRCLNG